MGKMKLAKLVLVAIGLIGLGYGFGNMLIPILGWFGVAGQMALYISMVAGFVAAIIYAAMGWVALKVED
jgi:hypothetical protein